MSVFTIGSSNIFGSPAGGSVGGATNLTTVGAVPYASAAGVLSQDQTANGQFFWDPALHRLGVGNADPMTELEVVSVATADPRGIASSQYTTDALGGRFQFLKARGTRAAPTTIVTADVLGRLTAAGYDSANFIQSARIEMGSSGTIAATRVPSYMAFWTSTNAAPSVITERMRIDNAGRVGIATPTPVAFLDVNGNSLVRGAYATSAGISGVYTGSISGTQYKIEAINPGTAGLELRLSGTVLSFFDVGSGANSRFAATTGNLLVGGATDGNFKLDVQVSGSSGIGRFYDQTATVGTTLLAVRAGAGQSGDLFQAQNNGGTAIAGVTSAGNGYFTSTLLVDSGGSWSASSGGMRVRSDAGLFYSSTTNASGTIDAGLARDAANVLQVNTGVAGTYAALKAARLQTAATTVGALPAAAAGNAGSEMYVTDANATTIGTTVAAGGANKVKVWSDGTNWKIYAS